MMYLVWFDVAAWGELPEPKPTVSPLTPALSPLRGEGEPLGSFMCVSCIGLTFGQ
jgi:hypothetical protein